MAKQFQWLQGQWPQRHKNVEVSYRHFPQDLEFANSVGLRVFRKVWAPVEEERMDRCSNWNLITWLATRLRLTMASPWQAQRKRRWQARQRCRGYGRWPRRAEGSTGRGAATRATRRASILGPSGGPQKPKRNRLSFSRNIVSDDEGSR